MAKMTKSETEEMQQEVKEESAGEKTYTLTESMMNDIMKRAREEARKEMEGRMKDHVPDTGIAKKEETEEEKFLQELVEIELIYDGERYKDDVFVSVNGHDYLIKRGERVLVPRYIAKALEDSQRQDLFAANVSKQFEKDFDTKREQLS